MSNEGRFVWYDLMTTDVNAAVAFYTEITGWKTQQWEGGEMPYTMFCVGEQPIGGVMTLPENAAKMGAPPHWMAYIQVADIGASSRQVEALGGKVLDGPRQIPTVGHFTVFADPTGATVALFQPESDMALHEGEPRQGDFTWHELNTTDWEKASTFYGELVGWQKDSDFDMGPEMGTYWMYKSAGGSRPLGGMSSVAKTMGFPPHWLYYIHVDDLDATVKRITDRGGKVMNGPMEVPGGDKIAQCMDPQGVAFALHWRKK